MTVYFPRWQTLFGNLIRKLSKHLTNYTVYCKVSLGEKYILVPPNHIFETVNLFKNQTLNGCSRDFLSVSCHPCLHYYDDPTCPMSINFSSRQVTKISLYCTFKIKKCQVQEAGKSGQQVGAIYNACCCVSTHLHLP